ncbi:MAG: hypothetical protein ACKN89_15955 [Cyanobium sp.]
MSGPALAKARLIPFGDAPNATVPEEARAIPFDFNPETLTLKVSTGQARDPARRGRQQTQNVGASQATLSFECIFDSTRPRDSDGDTSLTTPVRERDVRKRTRAIADLLQDVDPGRTAAPRRVRFLWGEFLFDGVVSQHQETFDYFSAGGVPLRSKVALTLTEKDFRYNVTAEQAQPLGDGAAALATGSGSNDQPPPQTPGQRNEAALAAALVPEVSRPSPAQIGQRLAAGLPLGATEALALFGAAALPAGAVLPSLTASTPGIGSGLSPSSTRATPQAGRPSSSWGREAAPAGSAAAGLAARVVAQRQAGLDPGAGPDSRVNSRAGAAQPSSRESPQPAPAAPPIRGHAQLRVRLALEPDPRLFPLPPRPERPPLEPRPRWEPEAWRRSRAAAGEARPVAATGGCACSCGCVPCRGGVR